MRGEYLPQSESEARAILGELARRRSGEFPPDLLVQQALAVTEGTDWSSRRAALDALLRRLGFAQRDELSIVERPRDGGAFGLYGLAGKRMDGGAQSKRRVARPYRTALYGLDPVRGSCDCPDFVRSSLGLCKHLMVVIEDVARDPSRSARVLREPSRGEATSARLCWEPVRAWTGQGDRLRGLFVAHGEPSAAPAGRPRRAKSSSGRQRGVAQWLDAGRPKPRVLEELGDRLAMLRELEAACADGALVAEPAAELVVREELARAERRHAARADASKIAAHLRSLKRPLYPFQQEGVTRFLEERRLLLADDMGLGKTIQAIAACHVLFTSGRVERGLVIVPASLKAQWVREWEVTTSKVPVVLVDGRAGERAKLYRTTKRGFLVISYELLLKDLALVHQFAPDLVVLDEAQRIKNWATKSSAYVMTLRPEWRLILTGTPMENRLEELATILDFVDDLALAPKWRLLPWHTTWEGTTALARTGARNLETLRLRLKPTLVRRLRRDVIRQLPPRTLVRVPVEMTEQQREEHDALAVPIVQLVQAAKRRPLRPQEFLRLMQLLAKQRMVSNGMALLQFDEVWPTYSRGRADEALLRGACSPKLTELQRIIGELVLRQGRKVIVFSQWRRMLQLAEWAVRDLLDENGLESVFFTGNESQDTRTSNVARLHEDPDVRVMFLTDAGGVGLNLQRAASACINLELPWNPAVLEQRIGRIHRLGQESPVDVVNLVSESGIESRIAGLVGNKRALFAGLFDGISDEVRYEQPAGFLREVERIIEPITIPELAVGPGSESPATMLSEVGDDVVLEQPAVEIGTQGGHTVVRAEAPGLWDRAPEIERSEDEAPATARGAEVPEATGFGIGGPSRVAELLAGVEVRSTPGGGLKLEAEPKAAAELAVLLDGLARLLRGAANGGGEGYSR